LIVLLILKVMLNLTLGEFLKEKNNGRN